MYNILCCSGIKLFKKKEGQNRNKSTVWAEHIGPFISFLSVMVPRVIDRSYTPHVTDARWRFSARSKLQFSQSIYLISTGTQSKNLSFNLQLATCNLRAVKSEILSLYIYINKSSSSSSRKCQNFFSSEKETFLGIWRKSNHHDESQKPDSKHLSSCLLLPPPLCSTTFSSYQRLLQGTGQATEPPSRLLRRLPRLGQRSPSRVTLKFTSFLVLSVLSSDPFVNLTQRSHLWHQIWFCISRTHLFFFPSGTIMCCST